MSTKNIRVSDYCINFPLTNDKNILLHGYSGAIDIIKNTLANKIRNNSIESMSEETISILKKRGYLTELKPEEEKNKFIEIVSLLIKMERKKNKAYTIIPTNSCNFNCFYCFENAAKKNRSWLNKKLNNDKITRIFEIIDVMDKEGENKNKSSERTITLFGGEPLLKTNYDLIDYIIHLGKQKGFRFEVITNGYDLPAFHKLLEEKFIDKLQITIDGDKTEHDKRRVLKNGHPTFEKIIENISKIVDLGIKINIRMNIDAKNIYSLSDFFDLYKLKDWDKNENISIYLSPVDYYNEKTIDFFQEKYLRIIENYMDKYPFVNFNNMTVNMILTSLRKKTPVNYRSVYCSSNNGGIIFDADGSLYSCWDVIGLGNFKIGTFYPTFKYNHEIKRQMDDRTIIKIEQCLNCRFALFCGGGCHINAIRYNGSDIKPKCPINDLSFQYFVKQAYNIYKDNLSLKDDEFSELRTSV